MPVIKKAKVFTEPYEEQPGNDYAQRDKDSVTWEVDPMMMFKGKMTPLGAHSGPQVGPPYDADALGEERAMITYENAGGRGVKPSTKRGG
jgi:hypothetical protein